MPDREQSTSALIPRIDPSQWEAHEGFRETLLRLYTDIEGNTTLRRLGGLLFTLSLECAPSWPSHPEGETRSELRAALADLRHLEGFLSGVGQEHIVSSLSAEDDALSRFAAQQARKLSRIAEEIEQAIDVPRG